MSRAIRAWRRAWTHATSGNESNDLRVGVARKAFVLERVRYNDRRHSMPHESPPSSKSRRLVLKLGGGTVLGTLLAACGGGGGADAAAAAPQQSPPAGPSSSANVAM
ncbi:hypothetical protein LV178_04370, partial [Burkholderia mallei]|nr:hypothetical protein [Burkholderia mallei]